MEFWNIKNDPILDKIKGIIVEETDPDKIILFGSRARGDHTESSDYDVLILKDELPKNRRITGKVYVAFSKNKLGVTVDLLAMETADYKKYGNYISFVYKEIEKDGKVIYARV